MRISDWSSDVCSSDLGRIRGAAAELSWFRELRPCVPAGGRPGVGRKDAGRPDRRHALGDCAGGCRSGTHLHLWRKIRRLRRADGRGQGAGRSEEHTSELQSLMRLSYAVFCFKKKKLKKTKL